MEKDDVKNTSNYQKLASFDPLFYQRPPSARTLRKFELKKMNSMKSLLPMDDETEGKEKNTTCLEIQTNNLTDFGAQSSEFSCQQNLNTSQNLDSLSTNFSLIDVNGDEIEEPLVPPDFPFSSSCIECVKPCKIFDRGDISRGDHIIIFGALYDHHAIVAEISPDDEEESNERKAKLTLIHATNTKLRALTGMSKIFGGKAKIQTTIQCLEFDKNYTMVVKYLKPRYSPSEIVERAINEKHEQTFKYNLFGNNCEHFATYCVTGERFSVQVRKLSMTLKMFFTRRFAGLSDERLRNKVAYERGLLCKLCFERNDKLLAAEKKPLRYKDKVNIGDIITFTYWNLHHDAVVMKVHERKGNKQIDLTVVHYAFCGFKHKTIKEERKTFSLDGSVTVTEYKSPPYNVYSPEETVQRARSRISEQQFAYFVNDSSHFARWSKLKLTQSDIPNQNAN